MVSHRKSRATHMVLIYSLAVHWNSRATQTALPNSYYDIMIRHYPTAAARFASHGRHAVRNPIFSTVFPTFQATGLIMAIQWSYHNNGHRSATTQSVLTCMNRESRIQAQAHHSRRVPFHVYISKAQHATLLKESRKSRFRPGSSSYYYSYLRQGRVCVLHQFQCIAVLVCDNCFLISYVPGIRSVQKTSSRKHVPGSSPSSSCKLYSTLT